MGAAEREAARRAVAEARSEAMRPWWQKRFFAWLTAVPTRLWRGVMAVFGVIVLLLS